MALSNDTIGKLVSSQAPVLCLDTCSILDLMRDVTRDNILPGDVTAALSILVAMELGQDLHGLIANQVQHELNEHLSAVQAEAEHAIKKIQSRMTRIDAIAQVLGANARADLAHLDSHVARARVAVNRLVLAAKPLLPSDNVTHKAFLRMNHAITPARKGKDSMKDCVVIESYLAAVSTLRSYGYSAKVVFVSSNHKDYATESSHSTLRPDLAAEFAALSMEYASNMGAAKHLLGV